MKNFFFAVKALLIILVVMFSIKHTSAQIQSGEVNYPIIDGKINSAEWAGAKVFTNFYMMIPRSDSKDYDSTIVYLKQSKDAIYLAFKYYPKGKIIAKSLVRDRSTEEENEFFVLLDLENKRQNGYIFIFNFGDNQRDISVYNQRSQSSEWDWVWESKTTVYQLPENGKPGYIETELKIPVDRLQNKNTKQIGIDFQMFAYRPDGTYYYYSLMPDSELLSLKSMYKLDITPFNERVKVDFNATPYIVGNKFNDSSYKAQIGGEFNVSIDKHKLKATINTDESTLEADPYYFSLYNRPTYLTEKRTFFSKDLDIYRSPISLFYTRSIQNIDYGFNYTFRSDKLKTGAMFVQDDVNKTGNKRQIFVARPNYVSSDFSVGSFLLLSNDKSIGRKEKVLSIDGQYRFPRNPVRVQGQYASNFEGNAFELYSYYQFDNSGGPFADLMYRKIDKNFTAPTFINTSVGIPNDYDEIMISGGYYWNKVRKYLPEINISGEYYRNKQLSNGFMIQDRYTGNLSVKIIGPISYSLYFEYNRPNDYDSEGNIIKRNNYLNDNYLKYVFGNNAVYAGYTHGPYFGTYLKNPYFGFNYYLFEIIAINTDVNFYRMFGQDRTIINTRLDYRALKKLYLRAFFQKDTQTKNALLNGMVQYEFFAGSNIYLVLNLIGDNLQHTSRYSKIGYEFNF
ncbi:MAG: hypothetical protein PHN88_07435 [Ignavibacteria bacterium]|nr:hypothetical protein [Ignavibacteria bacterium]